MIKNPCFFDDFLIDYDTVLEYMDQVEFFPSPRYNFPGKRSDLFHYINPSLQEQISKRLYELNPELENFILHTSFQKIFGYEDKNMSEGWVHTDSVYDVKGGPIYSAIVYLNKDADPDAGTTFCKPKISLSDPNANLKLRNFYYSQFDKVMK